AIRRPHQTRYGNKQSKPSMEFLKSSSEWQQQGSHLSYGVTSTHDIRIVYGTWA
ncbi:hypothetical protein ACLOJK_004046, partial [Asimina triloba]